jgi:hypothetical protein
MKEKKKRTIYLKVKLFFSSTQYNCNCIVATAEKEDEDEHNNVSLIN